MFDPVEVDFEKETTYVILDMFQQVLKINARCCKTDVRKFVPVSDLRS